MRYRKFFAQLKQRGQMLVLFALMIPVIMLFVGLALDLGWYYLNVSRLQNAADAAALAGARAIQDDSQAALDNQYYVVSLANNKLPEDFDDYENVFSHGFGELNYYRKLDDPNDTRGTDLLLHGRDHVEEYTRKNLADSAVINGDSADSWKVASATDGWNISASDDDKKVTGKIDLKYKFVDGKNDKYGQLYYVVTLSEKIRHFFLPGWFEGMNATVKAVVLLEPHDPDLLAAMWSLERTMVIDNWEYQNYYKGTDGFYYAGKWNHYQAGKGSDKTKGIKYSDGDSYRTESVVIKTQDRTKDSTSSGIQTSATSDRRFYGVNEVDSINIDFRAEILKKFTTDWDIGQAVKGQSYDFTEGWSATNGADKRILFNAEFDEAFPTRDATQLADVLWTRIESDPIKDLSYIPDKADHTSYNSVRQITLNFNADNTETFTSGDNKGHYSYRPYFVFYTGPEIIDYATDSSGRRIRRSQPVVINLNADLNAIIFMPNSPVVINGNNNDWTGFIIAKCFLAAVTLEDITSNNSVKLNDGFGYEEEVTFNCIAGTDCYDNTIYVERAKLFTRANLDDTYPNSTIKTKDNGNLSVYEEIKAPQYILLNFDKDDFTDCTTAESFYAKFAAIVNDNYKNTFKAYSELDDSQITAVTFPEENYNFTGATYYVATDDLSSTATDSDCVKVLLPDGTTTKYVSKKKLPYVKVRTDKEYFYVCVYDLKLTGGGGKGVRMIDGRYTDEELNSSFNKVSNVTSTAGDLFVNPSNTYGDSWEIDRTWYNNQHNKWKKDKLDFFDNDGSRYFMVKDDLIATYRKITVGEDTLYFKEGTTYYSKVQNNAHNANNYIIVDENGNILTKSLPAGSTRPTNANEQPTETSRIEDHTLEVVYVDPTDPSKPPFNLGTVEYSSFAVPELQRKFYKNLDDGGSVDMFFTTERAGWID